MRRALLRSGTIFTDSLRGYNDGIGFAFRGDKPKRIANSGNKKPHATDNRIERPNGTLKGESSEWMEIHADSDSRRTENPT
jgi:hypothetical protein